MNRIIAIVLAAGVALGTASVAEARDGCGVGFFRGPAGRCRPFVGQRGYAGPRGYVVAPGLVIGRYYTNRGYWDGRRYYAQRYRRNGDWRYR